MNTIQRIAKALVNSTETVILPIHPRTLKNLKDYDLYDELAKAKNMVLSDPLGDLPPKTGPVIMLVRGLERRKYGQENLHAGTNH